MTWGMKGEGAFSSKSWLIILSGAFARSLGCIASKFSASWKTVIYRVRSWRAFLQRILVSFHVFGTLHSDVCVGLRKRSLKLTNVLAILF
jgi:hypothetical protein